nr:acetate/propionate family kinase [Armatimonadota bacterium]
TQILPGVPQVAVFDTAFHQKMPPHAYIYGIPYVLYKRYAIRRYGFHGTSHFYVSRRAAELMNRPIEELRLITCHLGNGASMAAIKGGVSVDTSMGFTPLEGLLMGTRSGDLDPAIILHIMAREELSLHEANTLLNKHSGLQGVSGVSGDMRDIIIEAQKGNSSARLALDIYCYRVRKYIGAYAAALGGLDALVFTAGIGENSPLVRKESCQGLEFMDIQIDDARNERASGKQAKQIQTDGSKVKIFSIPTNEELVIAQETRRVILEAEEKKTMRKGL